MADLGQIVPRMPDVSLSPLSLIASFAQSAVSLAVCLLALALAWQMFRARGKRNCIQLDIDIRVLDPGTDHLIGEMVVALQNLGSGFHDLANLFIEVRQSRYVSRSGMTLVPPVNIIDPQQRSLRLAPGASQAVTWSFEMPRETRLIRAVAFIATGSRYAAEVVPMLSQEFFGEFGAMGRYTSRVFDVSPSLFR